MDDMRTIVIKKCVFFYKMGTCFLEKYGTKYSFSVKLEPIVPIPSSESRAEQIGPLSVI